MRTMRTMGIPDSETFAYRLADVYRGLLQIGYSEREAAAFVDSLCEIRYECLRLRRELHALKQAGALAPIRAGGELAREEIDA